MWTSWLIIAGIMFVGEILTAGFILFWFGIGALASAMISLMWDNSYGQIVVFIGVSTLLLVFTRPLIKTILKQKEVPSNVFAMVGKHGMVVENINNMLGQGHIKIGGEIWKAIAENGQDIEADTEVEIISVEGVKVIVREVVKEKIKEGVK